mmetsp:Transcript_35520/g.62265  ORF Transcript_35520/g.62265 Transcript_35520/m.62265 type:complete len:115 (+) Transcript_35520:92-436(+)
MVSVGPEYITHESTAERLQMLFIKEREWKKELHHNCINQFAPQLQRNKIVHVVSRSSPLGTPRVRRVIVPVNEDEKLHHRLTQQPKLCDANVAPSEAPLVGARQTSPNSIDACF